MRWQIHKGIRGGFGYGLYCAQWQPLFHVLCNGDNRLKIVICLLARFPLCVSGTLFRCICFLGTLNVEIPVRNKCGNDYSRTLFGNDSVWELFRAGITPCTKFHCGINDIPFSGVVCRETPCGDYSARELSCAEICHAETYTFRIVG